MATPPNFNQLLKEAQKMQEKMQSAQRELETMTVEGVSGAGMVKITMTGRYEAKKVTLDPNLMREELDIVEDLIAAAINDAVHKIEKETRGKMAGLTAGMNLPGQMNPFDEK